VPLSDRTLAVGVSAGTLSILGLSHAISFNAPTTAHLLVGEKCVNSCSFCSQAKCSRTPPGHLSRVTWPKKDWEEIRESLKKAIESKAIKRICIQVVENSEGTRDGLSLLEKIRALDGAIPVSVCIAPYSVTRAGLFLEQGASRVGLPLDAASPRVYREVKGGDISKAWDVIERAARAFPGRISTHFISGLGETEEEMVMALDKAKRVGVTVALFAFTPVRGTPMAGKEPPSLASYRRIQIAAYFLKQGGNPLAMEFADGNIRRMDVEDPTIVDGIMKGEPFQTSGCPDCNRPYYNERPGGPMLNFPRELDTDEAKACVRESGLFPDVVWPDKETPGGRSHESASRLSRRHERQIQHGGR